MPSVLITGASKGIGRATAVEFAKRGWRVVATARDPRTLDDLDVDQRLALDVTDQAGVDAAVAAAGEIDVLVSNAGIIFYAPVESIPIAEAERLFASNLFGALRVTQAVLPQMRRRGSGRVVYLSSIAGRVPLPAGAAYVASKWALEGLAETLALETANLGIDVTLVQPGPVSSGALDDVTRYDTTDGAYDHIYEGRTDGMVADTPEFVAAAIVDAASAEPAALRVPIGQTATALLAARKAAPEDVAFSPARKD